MIGIVAIITAIVSFIRYGKVNLSHSTGKIYLYGTIITSLTALGISKHGGFNPGHIFSILIVILVLVSFFLYTRRKGNNTARFFENFCLSFSFFLSLVPTVNETFTRIPVGHPWAKDISDPLIGKILLTLLILFIAGTVYQIIKQKKINKAINE